MNITTKELDLVFDVDFDTFSVAIQVQVLDIRCLGLCVYESERLEDY